MNILSCDSQYRYLHQKKRVEGMSCPDSFSVLVTPAGFKPTTFGTGIRRSIQLNYGALVIDFLATENI